MSCNLISLCGLAGSILNLIINMFLYFLKGGFKQLFHKKRLYSNIEKCHSKHQVLKEFIGIFRHNP